jgi:Fe/S biogenesis protein NfuA
MLTISDAARDQLLKLMEEKGLQDQVLRIAIRGIGPFGFQYEMGFMPAGECPAQDERLQANGIEVAVEAASRDKLQGSTLDFVEGPMQSGFKIENPNPMWDDPVAERVQRVLQEQINPSVAAHGGFITLLKVEDQVAYIVMGGGCQGCGLANATLQQGVETAIKEAVPEIREVVDATNHAAGERPFYR